MGKKKKKNKCYEEYDYSDINYGGDIVKLMKEIANSLECYLDNIETYVIFEGITEKQWDESKKSIEKLIRKLRKGDPSVFDVHVLNDILASDHQLVVGMRD